MEAFVRDSPAAAYSSAASQPGQRQSERARYCLQHLEKISSVSAISPAGQLLPLGLPSASLQQATVASTSFPTPVMHRQASVAVNSVATAIMMELENFILTLRWLFRRLGVWWLVTTRYKDVEDRFERDGWRKEGSQFTNGFYSFAVI